jgi:hypothetical protein
MIGCLLPALVACSPTPAVSTSPTGYSCCEASDVKADYQPGDTYTVHWIVVDGSPSADTVPFALNASLSGPYSDVGALKGTDIHGLPAADATYSAEPVHPAGTPGERPVSSNYIPSDAKPGLYNLVTSVSEPGGTTSGASIITISPAV